MSALDVDDVEARPWRRFCECGAGITLVGKNDADDDVVLAAWDRVHSGFGHEDRVTSGEARHIRHAGRRNLSYVRVSDRG